MPRENLMKLGRRIYPTGSFPEVGENLRVLALDGSAYVPPMRGSNKKRATYPIVVPTHRNVRKNRKNIERIIRVAASNESSIVLFLCSGEAKREDIATIAGKYSDVNWVAIDGPYSAEWHELETTYSPLAYGRQRDISQKRNFALQLAQLMGWEALFFLDDDIAITGDLPYKAMNLLSDSSAAIVGFNVRSFPDNSVTVHAARLFNSSIDSFIGTGALAVKMNSAIVSFFPHIYGEDWFFLLSYFLFGREDVVWAGTVTSLPYDPFKNRKRALREEAGDLIGESLFHLAMSVGARLRELRDMEAIAKELTALANESFWGKEINQRIVFIRDMQARLMSRKFRGPKTKRVLNALNSSMERLMGKDGRPGIQAGELSDWVRAWTEDLLTMNATKKFSVGRCANLIEAMAALKAENELIYNFRSTNNSFEGKAIVTTEQDNAPRSDKAKLGLEYTKILENYLVANDRDINDLVESAALLRLDRPIEKPESSPVATVLMVIGHGEPFDAISESVRQLALWNKSDLPVELVTWVHSMAGGSLHELENYRDQVTANIITEIAGTNIRLSSSISTDVAESVDDTIGKALGRLVLAYWKRSMPGDKLVFVVNSKNEILRWGRFWDLIRGEHKIPNKRLESCIRELSLPEDEGISAPISNKEDQLALRIARERLAMAAYRRSNRLSIRKTLTKSLAKQMKRAGLSLSQIDNLGYDYRFHDEETELVQSIPVERILCIPVSYANKQLPSDRYSITSEIISLLKRKNERLTKRTNCFIIICGGTHVSWQALENYRMWLMDVIVHDTPARDTVFTSFVYRDQLDESDALFKARSLAVASYMRWLVNYEQSPKVKWCTIDASS